MALWNKLQTELDRFGRAAQSAFDEGKARLEIMRVRQLADKAAQALGYAVYNARKSGGGDLDADSYARLTSTLAAHEAEAQRLEAQMEEARAARAEATGATGDAGDASTGGADASSGSASGAAGGPGASGDSAYGSSTHGSSAGGSADAAPHADRHGSVDPAMGDRGPSSSGPTPPYSGPVSGY